MTQERSPSGIPVSTGIPDVSADNTIAGGITREALREATRLMAASNRTLDATRPLIAPDDLARAREDLLTEMSATFRQRLASFIGQTITPQQHARLFAALQDCVNVLSQITHEVEIIQVDPVDNSIRFNIRPQFQPRGHRDIDVGPIRGSAVNTVMMDETIVSTPPTPRATPVVDVPGVLVDPDGNPIDYDTAVNDLRNWVQAEGYLAHVPVLRNWVSQPEHAGQILRLWEFWGDYVYSLELPPAPHLRMYVIHFEDLLATESVGVLRGIQYAAEVRIALAESDEFGSDASMSLSSMEGSSPSLDLLHELVERLSGLTDLPPAQSVVTPPRMRDSESDGQVVGSIRSEAEMFDAFGQPNADNPLARAAADAINEYTRQQMQRPSAFRQLFPQIGEAVGHTAGLDRVDFGATTSSGPTGPVGHPGTPGPVGHPGPIGAIGPDDTDDVAYMGRFAGGPASTTPDFSELDAPEPTYAGERPTPHDIDLPPLVIPPHIPIATGPSVCESQEPPSSEHCAFWSLWSDKYNRFLVLSDNSTLTLGGTVPKLRFQTRTSAELFRPDLVPQLDLVAVQCLSRWWLVTGVAVVVYNGYDHRQPSGDQYGSYGRYNSGYNRRDIRLLRVIGDHAIWMEDEEAKASNIPHVTFAAEREGMQMLDYMRSRVKKHILQSDRRGSVYVDVMELKTLGCASTKFFRPVTSGQIDPTTGRPVRDIEFH